MNTKNIQEPECAARNGKERLCTTAFEAVRDAVCLIDLEGRILNHNQVARRLLGKFAPELNGHSLCDLVDRSARHLADCPVARMKKTQRRETTVIQLGSRWLEITVDPVLDERQQLVGAVHVISDISLRKRAEEAVALLRTWIDRSNDAMELLDPETGCFLDVNAKGCGALGYTREEFLALSVSDVDPCMDAPTFVISMERLRASGSMTWRSIRRRKDGTTFPVEVGLTHIRLDRCYLIAVVRDITEHNRPKETLPDTNAGLTPLAYTFSYGSKNPRVTQLLQTK